MKKSIILLIAFLILYFGGSFLYNLQSKNMSVIKEGKIDTTTYSLPSYSVVNHGGFWNITIKQGLIPKSTLIGLSEDSDSALVFVRNDTLYISNQKTNGYMQEIPSVVPVFEITLQNNQKVFTVCAQSKARCFYHVNNIKLDELIIYSGFQAHTQYTRLSIFNSSITNLLVKFDFVNMFDYQFVSDTIQNVTFKLCGNVSATPRYSVGVANGVLKNDSFRTDTCFKNSMITNYNLECFGVGTLDLGGNTHGTITGKINGAIELKYPAAKDISTLTMEGACNAFVPPKWLAAQ